MERAQMSGFRKVKTNDELKKKAANGEKRGIMTVENISKSVKIPDDCTHLLKADTNFKDKNISNDIVRAIDETIDKRLSENDDFLFDEIKIARFSDDDKSVLITNLEVFGDRKRTQLYLNKLYFENSILEDINSTCLSLYSSGWWKSKNLYDLVNHEIMHARINNYNSIDKVEQLYQLLSEDTNVKGFCRLVDEYPSEFLNEVYVALHNGEAIEDKYLNIYNKYIKKYLGGNS